MLRTGIYKQLIDRRLTQELDQLPENQKATAMLDQAESSSVLSQYVADVVRKALERMHDSKSELPDQIALVNQLVAMVGEIAEEDIDGISVDERAQQLLSLISEKGPHIALGKSAKDVIRTKERNRLCLHSPTQRAASRLTAMTRLMCQRNSRRI